MYLRKKLHNKILHICSRFHFCFKFAGPTACACNRVHVRTYEQVDQGFLQRFFESLFRDLKQFTVMWIEYACLSACLKLDLRPFT